MDGRIVLIGFMGSGKSSVAAALGEIEQLPVAEMDTLISEAADGLSIPQIFEQFGEAHFRALEEQVAGSLQSLTRIIISAGGGVVEYPRTMTLLRKPGTTVVYLKTSLATVKTRLGSSGDSRPLFRSAAVDERYWARLPLYGANCDMTVETDGLSVTEVAAEVAARLRQQQPA